ncbi:MAG: shikimate dehydrogenase [Firmicutes bacterium]|nr:shikimate dehydrogenase [Bacillota bacterium]
MEYGCIGEHLGHSFSAVIHRDIGRYDYELREVAPAELDSFLRRREFRGVNVTIPYKQAVIPYLHDMTERARRIGAVNTIVNRDGLLYGDNTDFGGLQALIDKAELPVTGAKALILGTGGTSRTARAVLSGLGAGEIVRVSRGGHDCAVTYEQAYAGHRDAQLVVNTTPCGMFPDLDSQPLRLSAFPDLRGVVDVIYNPLRSRLVLEAESRGVKAIGGLYMLVAQAVQAAEVFTGEKLPEGETDRIYGKLRTERENLVLIGMPGCGKSTVGVLLSLALGRELLDLDELIIRQAGCPISEIFARQGETAFRDLETQTIAAMAGQGGRIIATGGGAVLREENVRRLSQNGRLIFLDRPLSQLLPTADRPLADDEAKLRRLYRERYPIYQAAADLTVAAGEPPEAVARTIIRSLGV